MKLTSKRELMELFARHSVTPLRQLGQNFLVDQNMLERIVDCAALSSEDSCLEIGPGAGALTRELCARTAKVLAVELDRGMVAVLGETLSGLENVTVVHGDALKVDLGQLTTQHLDRPFKVVANLPYYISTAVLMRLLEIPSAQTISVLVQKEVAQRMTAGPGGKDYGILSLAVQYYTQAKVVLRVPPTCFYPKPKVDSVVVRLERRDSGVFVRDEAFLFGVVKACFAQRRKTIANNLSAAFAKDIALASLEQADISPAERAERLDISQFAALSNALLDVQNNLQD
ncbi:MAG: 16S rRNA (adenine(1518)-N(6)/adenine(1519)-N(6))-dimethyltransferase RsmA [Christensenellales bacterium]